MIQNLSYHPALGDSDHCCLTFDLSCYASHYKRKEEEKANNYRADYASIRSRLKDIHWEELLNGTLQEDHAVFIGQLEYATEKMCLNKKCPYDHSAFIQSKNKLRNLTRKLRADYEINIANQSKGKSKTFRRYVKSKLKTRVRIPTLKKVGWYIFCFTA